MISPTEFDSAIRSWASGPVAGGVRPEISPSALIDESDSYSVTYTARLSPNALDKLALEIWLTDEGQIAIGVETWERVGRRIGEDGLGKRFAGGHEPIALPISAVLAIASIVAEGLIAIKVFRSSLSPRFSTQLLAPPGIQTRLREAGYPTLRWLEEMPKDGTKEDSNVLLYRPWSTSK